MPAGSYLFFINTPLYIEMVAVTAGALSGALHAARRQFDLTGVTTIAVSTGLGGGIIRDLLLDQGAVLALRYPWYLETALIASLAVSISAALVKRLSALIRVVDALAIGLFAVMGAQRALGVGLSTVSSAFVGVVTSVGGSVIRDVLCNETPQVLVPGTLFSTPALLAALLYIAARRLWEVPAGIAQLVATLAAFSLRMLSLWRNWHAPLPTELTRRRPPNPPL